MPHTYQVRDFVPKLATAMERAAGQRLHRVQDTTDDKLLFTRQMFQGKFAADVSFTGDGPMVRQLPERSLSRRSS